MDRPATAQATYPAATAVRASTSPVGTGAHRSGSTRAHARGPATAVALDATAWVVGVVGAVGCQYGFALTRDRLAAAATIAFLAVGLGALVGHTQDLYRDRRGFDAFDEVGAVTATAIGTSALLLVFDVAFAGRLVPASGTIIGGILALVLMLGRRYLLRLRYECPFRTDQRQAAGEAQTMAPPAVAPPAVAPRAVAPPAGGAPNGARDGRSSVAGCLTARRVLVTGAGGTIGSELCRQICLLQPAELVMLDRDASALQAVALSLRGRAPSDAVELVLADLHDPGTIREVFRSHRPQVVFHAASLQHLALLERYPVEAVKNNIWGILAMLEQASEVDTFVTISTDQAANPVSVLGYSHRIAERLTAYASTRNAGTFLNVRFGTVLGGRSSIRTAFRAQVAAGGTITLSHPDLTGYLRTVPEVVGLILQAVAIGRAGETLVLDLGTPVRIADIAAQLAEQAPDPVTIVYTGRWPGQRVHESLFAEGEKDLRPWHPLVSHVTVPPLHPEHIRLVDPTADRATLAAELVRLCHLDPSATDRPVSR